LTIAFVLPYVINDSATAVPDMMSFEGEMFQIDVAAAVGGSLKLLISDLNVSQSGLLSLKA
jgi:hypothetical protein